MAILVSGVLGVGAPNPARGAMPPAAPAAQAEQRVQAVLADYASAQTWGGSNPFGGTISQLMSYSNTLKLYPQYTRITDSNFDATSSQTSAVINMTCTSGSSYTPRNGSTWARFRVARAPAGSYERCSGLSLYDFGSSYRFVTRITIPSLSSGQTIIAAEFQESGVTNYRRYRIVANSSGIRAEVYQQNIGVWWQTDYSSYTAGQTYTFRLDRTSSTRIRFYRDSTRLGTYTSYSIPTELYGNIEFNNTNTTSAMNPIDVDYIQWSSTSGNQVYYPTTGNWTSAAYNVTNTAYPMWTTVAWSEGVVAGSAGVISPALRFSADNVTWTSWCYPTNGATINTRCGNQNGKRYVQAGAWFTSTNLISTDVLNSMTVNWTVDTTAPAAFNKSGPANGVNLTNSNVTLSWGASSDSGSGLSRYEYCYDTTVDGACSGAWASNTLMTSKALTLADGLYEWQVRVVDNAGNTTYGNGSAPWTFRVDTAAPGAFGKTGLANGAALASANVTLAWTASADAGGLNRYEYCYDTAINGACTGAWTSNVLSTSKVLTLADGQYEWQVRAVDWVSNTTYADGAATAVRTFRVDTTAPNAFGKTSPANGAMLASAAVTLTWTASADGGSGLSRYEYCYDTTVDGTCSGAWITNALTTSRALSLTDGRYEWQVRAADGVSHTTYADGAPAAVRTFRVDTTGLNAFGKIGPADGVVLAEGDVTLEWMASADDGSGLSRYEYCYDSAVNGSCSGAWTSVGVTTSAALSLTDGQYEWQVRALDGVRHTT